MRPPYPELALATATAALGLRVLKARTRDQHDASEDNTYGLPEGHEIAKELRAWFARQREAVEKAIPDNGPLPERFPDLSAEDWTDPMKTAMTPMIGGYWDESGKEVYTRLGLDPDEWRVTNPKLREQIARQSLNFCANTNATTTTRLDRALDQLRQSLTEGLIDEGEALPKLRDRVAAIFEGMSQGKAQQIAATEASRAVHAAQLAADEESEVVAGLELLLSSDACPLCRKIAAECQRVRLGQSFATIGNHAEYRDIRHPPLHPSCQCTCIEVLKPEYGGPEHPEWGTTLDQPQKGLAGGYEPPKGKTVPEPEPGKAKPAIKVPATPRPPAITRAIGIASEAGVKVDPAGHARLAEQYGASKTENIPAAYHSGSKTILINERSSYWSNPERTQEQSARTGWFSTNNQDHVIEHEIGHALHDRADPGFYASLRGREFNENQAARIADRVSRYGASSAHEFVAEVRAGMISGKTYDNWVMQFYEKLKGPLPGTAPSPEAAAGAGFLAPAKDRSGKPLPKPSDLKVRAAADKQEKGIARLAGGKRLNGYEEADVVIPLPGHKGPLSKNNALLDGVARHAIEVKSLPYGEGDDLSVHKNALLRKVDYALRNPETTFHTVAVDLRGSPGFTKYKERYSGQTLYYKRASGPYFLSSMYKVKDEEELKRLIEMADEDLPEAARGSFPSGKTLDDLRIAAVREKEYNDQRGLVRREKKKAKKEAESTVE